MSCACVRTAILKENENEQLRKKIKSLEKKVRKYQEELFVIYSSRSGSDYNSSDNSPTTKSVYTDYVK